MLFTETGLKKFKHCTKAKPTIWEKAFVDHFINGSWDNIWISGDILNGTEGHGNYRKARIPNRHHFRVYRMALAKNENKKVIIGFAHHKTSGKDAGDNLTDNKINEIRKEINSVRNGDSDYYEVSLDKDTGKITFTKQTALKNRKSKAS